MEKISDANRHNRLSVQPLVTFRAQNSVLPIKLQFANDGLGPASIDTFYIRDACGAELRLDRKHSDQAVHFERPAHTTFYFFSEGANISAGEVKTICESDPEISEVERSELVQWIQEVELVIVYKSIYGETFEKRSSYAGTKP